MADPGSSGVDSASDWSEHTTPEGKKYYYNLKTQVSTWEKPEPLKKLEEEKEEPCPWTEHTTDDGKKYYYNHLTKKSVWEMPPDFKAPALAVAKASPSPSPLSPVRTKVTDNGAAEKKASKEEAKSKKNLSPKEAAIATFKELLSEMRVDYTWTWDNTMRAIIHDDRYRVLPTLAERKQIWSEYTEEMKRKEKEERRAKEESERNGFIKMLAESGQVTPRLGYRKAAQMFERDPRWRAVERERDREDLYDDFVWEMEQKELEEERERQKIDLAAYQQLIAEHPKITVKTQWRKLKDDLRDDPRFKAVDRLTRLTVFEARIKELERKEMEQKRIERDNKRRQERKNRDAFRAMLHESYNNGVFNVRTKWKDFRNKIKDTELYTSMLGQSGSTPHELYGDFLEDLEERYARDEAILQNIVKEHGVVVTAQSGEEGFFSLVAGSPEASSLDPTNVRVFFDDLKQEAIKAEDREKAKLVKNFSLMLKGFKEALNENSVWGNEVRNMMLQEPSYIALDDDAERERVFNEYIQDLKRTAKKPKKDEDSSSEEEGLIRSSGDEAEKAEKKVRRKDKKRRKHRHHHRDDGHGKRHKKHKKSRKKDRDSSGDEAKGSKKSKRRHSDSEGEREEKTEGREKKRQKAEEHSPGSEVGPAATARSGELGEKETQDQSTAQPMEGVQI